MNSIGQIIRKYRKLSHYTQTDLAKKLGDCGIRITSKAVWAWEKGIAEPSAGTFLQVCRILNIPDCVEEFFGENPNNPLSILNEDGKSLVRQYINSLASPVSYLKTEKEAPAAAGRKMRSIRLYDLRVSAGTGNFADSDQYAEIEVDEKTAGDADFAVTISGDSMMPRFKDHQTVFVHEQSALESGEIGIFYLNDSVYIKKFQNDRNGLYLLSLNPKYDPIPVDPSQDSFRIFGKVCG
ncbi:MAG: S24 family peptidase [Lachnospiraceae bacterium]|jgi:repressor LexA